MCLIVINKYVDFFVRLRQGVHVYFFETPIHRDL